MTADEEARAAAYRAQLRRRAKVMRARALALSGDPAAEADLKRRWAPLDEWLKERRGGPGGTTNPR